MDDIISLDEIHTQKDWKGTLVLGPRPYIQAENIKTGDKARIPLGATLNNAAPPGSVFLRSPEKEMEDHIFCVQQTITELTDALTNLSQLKGQLTERLAQINTRDDN